MNNLKANLGIVFGPNPIEAFMNRQASQSAYKEELPQAVRDVLAKPVSYFKEQAGNASAASTAPLTNIAFILDVSGSMEHGKASTLEGFNHQVEVVRKGAQAAGRTTFTEVQFATGVNIRRVASDLEQMQPLTNETYQPNGMTALYDALGDTIAELLKTEAIEAAGTATLVTLFTDGGENSSRRYGLVTLRGLIERLEATGRWTFALVGPTGTVGALGDALAVKPGNIAAYNPTSIAERTEVFGRISEASATYMSMRSAGVTQSVGLFSPEVPNNAE